MTLTMTHDKLFDLLSQYEQVGFMEAVRAYEPTQDLIRETEVKAWLKMMRVDFKLFKTMVAEGVIIGKRIGEARNSPWYYSKKDIKRAVAASKVASVFTESNISNSNNF